MNCKQILLITGMAVFSIGCASEQKLKKKATEYFQTHPTELAELCIEEFPTPDVIYIPGDTIVEYKSIIHPGVYLPCPDPTPEKPNPTVKCPDCKEITKYIHKTDTLKVADTRQIFICQNELKTVNQLNETLAMENNSLKDELRAAKNARNNWMWIAICLGVAIIIFVLVKIFK